jgi:aminotransferase
LRHAIAEKLERHNGLKYDPRSEIVVTAGSTGAFYDVCLALFENGDEAILIEPYYGYHLDTLRLCSVTPRFARLLGPNFDIDFDSLERAVSEKTKALVLNTPGNPSGKVFSPEELEEIGRFAEKHDLYVITDEIYEYFLYDDRQHTSPATVGSLRERTITMGGFSKTFSITGWRIGYLAAPAALAERLGFLNDIVYVCAPAPLQYAVAQALGELGGDFFEALRAEYTEKRDAICSALSEAGFPPFVPQGAYYVLADLSRIPGSSSKERALRLLETTGVAAVPGSAFYHGSDGDNLARFCFAKTNADLEQAYERLRRARF